MKKFLVTIIALVAGFVAANAQTVETTHEYAQFTSIEVSKFFEVKLCYGEKYAAVVTADQLIADNVNAYVKGNTLYLTVDEKGYAPEVKKALKGKNAIVPILRAVVYVPSINSIKVSDEAIVYTEDNLKSDVLKIEASNSANIKNLTADAQDVAVKLTNKAQARFDIYTNSIAVDASNSVGATFVLNCTSAAIGTAGSSNVSLSVEAKTISSKSQGSSTVTLTGMSDKLDVEASNSSSVLSDGLVVADANVNLSNSSLCEVNAKDHLKVDLTGSSHLVFNGNPSVNVERIVSSSMTRSSDTKYRKK